MLGPKALEPARLRQFDPAVWLTTERAAYGLIALVALVARLVILGQSPLGADEAVQALRALEAARGVQTELVGVSPLLFGLQRVLFAAFAPSDTLARWWPALLGGLTVQLFFPLRRRLGRDGALASALLWAVAPMGVFTGRLGLSYGLVAPLALAVLAGLTGAVDELDSARVGSQRRASLWLMFAFAAMGALLAAGPGAYTVLLIALVGALVEHKAARQHLDELRPFLRTGLMSGGITFVLAATFFLSRPDGLAAAFDQAGAWLGAAWPGQGVYSPLQIMGRLLLSEPLLLGFGLAGAVRVLRKRDPFGSLCAWAAGLSVLVAVVGRGRHPADIGLIVLTLTLLAGPVVAHVIEGAWAQRRSVDAWLLFVVDLTLLGVAVMCLVSALNPSNNVSWRQLYTGVGIVTAVLAALLWLVYGVWGNWRTVACVFPVVLLVFGLVWGLSQLGGVNFDRGAWRQPGVLSEMPTRGWEDLQKELGDLAALHGSGARETPVDLVMHRATREDPGLAPALMWALRAFPSVRQSESVPQNPAPIVITLSGDQPALASTYRGAEFALVETWSPASLPDVYAWVRWILYREATVPGDQRSVILWVESAENGQ